MTKCYLKITDYIRGWITKETGPLLKSRMRGMQALGFCYHLQVDADRSIQTAVAFVVISNRQKKPGTFYFRCLSLKPNLYRMHSFPSGPCTDGCGQQLSYMNGWGPMRARFACGSETHQTSGAHYGVVTLSSEKLLVCFVITGPSLDRLTHWRCRKVARASHWNNYYPKCLRWNPVGLP